MHGRRHLQRLHALTMLRLVKRIALGLLAFTVGAVVIAALLCRDNGEATYVVG